MKTYSEMILLPTYADRLEYLKVLDNDVLSPRYMSMDFYKSSTWKFVRKKVLDRDLRFDLAVHGLYIDGIAIIHHINPITESDIIYQTKKLLDPENLITVSVKTHNLIHYNKKSKDEWVERKAGDTKFW